MSTTNAAGDSGGSPVQIDGVDFRGIIWFVAVIFVTTFVCQGLVAGMFKYFVYDVDKTDTARAPLAAAASMPEIKDGAVLAGRPMPEPYLLADDPAPLVAFRAEEENLLTTYGVADKNADTYRIPIERAKDLLLKQGLPARTSK
ncbi:MAG TPA: hypothetical protein VIX35_12030 [Vicinamibacterales bacterium]